MLLTFALLAAPGSPRGLAAPAGGKLPIEAPAVGTCGSVMYSGLRMSELQRQNPHGCGEVRSAEIRRRPLLVRHLAQSEGRLQSEKIGCAIVELCHSSLNSCGKCSMVEAHW